MWEAWSFGAPTANAVPRVVATTVAIVAAPIRQECSHRWSFRRAGLEGTYSRVITARTRTYVTGSRSTPKPRHAIWPRPARSPTLNRLPAARASRIGTRTHWSRPDQSGKPRLACDRWQQAVRVGSEIRRATKPGQGDTSDSAGIPRLRVADNTGAKEILCIRVLGGRRDDTPGSATSSSPPSKDAIPGGNIKEGRGHQGRHRPHYQRASSSRRQLHPLRRERRGHPRVTTTATARHRIFRPGGPRAARSAS